MKHISIMIALGFSFILLAACGGNTAAGNEGEYDTTKKMVVDILQTEDGKKAIQEIMADEEMKKELVIETDVVKKSINETLAGEKGKEMWKKLFEDPKFVEGFAKSMEDQQQQLIKKLMNDAEYQEKMLELLKDPKMTEQLLSVMKSQEFRAHLEKTIQETLETPTFQAKIQEILLKAAEKQGSGGGGQQQSGGQGGGGGQSGGGGESSGGGGQ
ncbi:spore germination lipoprotein GerD [Virgibacillus xinjiangensis]|uniref:Spore germination lipoprotein GerD n=1 Tax=Virgibacillus xinjiangensis TaxID=393090 RepID=A0ABV7CWP3_9BACI